MKAEIISVGTELLLGQIVDTNAVYLSQQLAKLGIDLFRRATVGDNRDRIAAEIKEALSRAQLVLVTGGLGPTPDDVTAAGIADAFLVQLVRHPEAEKWLTDLLLQRGITPSPTLLKQADLPENTDWLPNPVGTAPGIWMERGGKIVVAMPGVPAEMEAMFQQEVVPRLQRQIPGEVFRWRILRFSGIGESALTDRLSDLMQSSNPTLGTSVKPGEVWLLISAKAKTEEETITMLDEVEVKVRERVGNWLISLGDEPIEVLVVERLRELGLTIATAESITGGLVCSTLINVPGSSNYVRGGIIAYNDAVKMHLLGVPWEVLQTEGAVSEECAKWMANQARTRLKAHIGVATTGYAGPKSGEPNKPVGTVFVAVSTPNETKVERYQLRGARQQIRERATYLALVQILRVLRTLF